MVRMSEDENESVVDVTAAAVSVTNRFVSLETGVALVRIIDSVLRIMCCLMCVVGGLDWICVFFRDRFALRLLARHRTASAGEILDRGRRGIPRPFHNLT